jgi:hypothetical protein
MALTMQHWMFGTIHATVVVMSSLYWWHYQ